MPFSPSRCPSQLPLSRPASVSSGRSRTTSRSRCIQQCDKVEKVDKKRGEGEREEEDKEEEEEEEEEETLDEQPQQRRQQQYANDAAPGGETRGATVSLEEPERLEARLGRSFFARSVPPVRDVSVGFSSLLPFYGAPIYGRETPGNTKRLALPRLD